MDTNGLREELGSLKDGLSLDFAAMAARLERLKRDGGRVDQDGLWCPPDWQSWDAGQLLWARRRLSELSQDVVARRAGLRQGTVSVIEAGKDARLSSVMKIAGALDCELVLRLRPRAERD